MFSLLLDLVPGTEMDGDYSETGLEESALRISVFRKEWSSVKKKKWIAKCSTQRLPSRSSGAQTAFLCVCVGGGSGPTPSIKHTWSSLFSQWLSVETSVLFVCVPSIVFLCKLQQLPHTLGAYTGHLTRCYVIFSKVLARLCPCSVFLKKRGNRKHQRHATTPCQCLLSWEHPLPSTFLQYLNSKPRAVIVFILDLCIIPLPVPLPHAPQPTLPMFHMSLYTWHTSAYCI